MALGSDLSKVEVKRDQLGRLVAAGLDDDQCWFELSGDLGQTLVVFNDGSSRKLVSGSDDSPPTIELMNDGTVIVCLTSSGVTETWYSRDLGEHWTQLP